MYSIPCTVSLYPLLHRSRWSQDQLQKNEDPARWTQLPAESSYNDKRIYSRNLQ